jgi:hypothetical protein
MFQRNPSLFQNPGQVTLKILALTANKNAIRTRGRRSRCRPRSACGGKNRSRFDRAGRAAPAAQAEIDGLIRSGTVRLKDAGNAANSLESRFDLAYNAAHALSLAALRWHGYRSENRYLVFRSLTHT